MIEGLPPHEPRRELPKEETSSISTQITRLARFLRDHTPWHREQEKRTWKKGTSLANKISSLAKFLRGAKHKD